MISPLAEGLGEVDLQIRKQRRPKRLAGADRSLLVDAVWLENALDNRTGTMVNHPVVRHPDSR